MEKEAVRRILEQVAAGETSVAEAELALKQTPFTDLGFAKLDTHRSLRQGAGEVVYGAGKTPAQIARITEALQASGQTRVLITRLSPEAAAEVQKTVAFSYYEAARLGIAGGIPAPEAAGEIVIATGGTSDMPVAEEAALTAEFYANRVTRLYDVGVAGLHRLLAHIDDIQRANVIVAIAGMEGALASVIGGLADCPVIAVPTSVGYGAAFQGVAALLSMLNSCASGVSVVNIDNGFGAGFLASRINHMGQKSGALPRETGE
ncbi:MAG: nickel pincer cofactor biosynthesis protein LarB [Faecalibacterium sp.]|jgi:NCAIR mutase (PurE)-related protein|nr:nickel pincer cofactor biosynthesis protein LarB [Faecalibacterium sp.]